MRRAVETTRLHFRHHTWGPTDLFYGDLYASREVPCKSTSIPGVRDPYAACCSVELMKEDGFDFLLLSLPDNDNYSHKHGPEATVESIAKADECFGTLVEEAGGMDAFLAEHAVILLADHAQTDVHRGLPLADLLAAEWSVLQPSDDRPELAQLAVSPTGRAAHVYLLPGDAASGPSRRRWHTRLTEIEGVDLVCRLLDPDGAQLRREEPGMPPRGGEWAAVSTARGGGPLPAGGGGRGPARGELGDRGRARRCWRRRSPTGKLRSETYPDPLARVWSALTAPHAGDFVLSLEHGFEAVDWGGVTHAGGGSHGALHAGDSLGPLLFVGCGPESAGEREQWTLRDVAPVVREHFGLGAR